jgi:hypothetical protein
MVHFTMRLTINLDEDLYALAKAHAVAERISMSKAVNALLRVGLAADPSSTSRLQEQGEGYTVSSMTGFRVNKGREDVTPADVQAALQEEEDAEASQTVLDPPSRASTARTSQDRP